MLETGAPVNHFLYTDPELLDLLCDLPRRAVFSVIGYLTPAVTRREE